MTQPEAIGVLFRPLICQHCVRKFINRMIDAHVDDSIVVASFAGKKCHPALLPWHLTDEIFDLADDEGVNAIIDRRSVVEVSIEENITDIDTPEDYKRAISEKR